MEEIDIGEVEPTEEDKLQMATEQAYAKLADVAYNNGLTQLTGNWVGLMYLPNEKVTQQFRDACKAVIDCLKTKSVNG